MRHHNKNKKFGRERNERLALMRSLARSLILNERIETTEAKAKALRPFVERLVTEGLKGSIASRRNASARLGGNATVADKLIEKIAPRYKTRRGGYTRIIKLGRRRSDAALKAVIEFV